MGVRGGGCGGSVGSGVEGKAVSRSSLAFPRCLKTSHLIAVIRGAGK